FRRPRAHPPRPTLLPYTPLFRSASPRPRAGDLRHAAEEPALPLAADRPVHRHALVALVIPLALEAVVEQPPARVAVDRGDEVVVDRKSTRLNSSHVKISYAVFCL